MRGILLSLPGWSNILAEFASRDLHHSKKVGESEKVKLNRVEIV